MCVFADNSSPAVVVVTDQHNFFASVNLVQRTYAVTVLRRAPQLTHSSGTPRVTLRFSGRAFRFIKRPMAAHRKRHGHPFADLDV